MLRAIALYRKKDSIWKEKLNSALDAAQEFGFIRTISVYGAAVLSLLEQTEYKNDDEWFARLIKDVRVEASFYPLIFCSRICQWKMNLQQQSFRFFVLSVQTKAMHRLGKLWI